MPQIYLDPQHHLLRFVCPRCGAFAAQEWRELLHERETNYGNAEFDEVRDVGDEVWTEEHDDEEALGKLWEASLCSGCNEHSLWIEGKLAFPTIRTDASVPDPSADMPDDARELYLEAAAVLPHSRRAAAALCRASLERLARHLTPELKGKNLDGRLLALSKRTTGSTTRALLFIRHVGNTALHGAKDGDESAVIYLDAPEDDVVGMLFVTIVELVNELITRPRIIERSFELVPVQVREDFERKAAELEGERE